MSSGGCNLRLLDPGPSGTVLARHYRDGSCWSLSWNEEGLVGFEPVQEGESRLFFAPGLFDLQVNGYGGIDFQRDCSAAELRKAAEALRRDGCHRGLLTLITRPWEELLSGIAVLRKTVRSDPFLNRAFPGWHVEGPFLSAEPGYCGAHNPRWMRDPRPEDILRLKEVVGDDALMLTLAPERRNSAEVISQAVKCGFVVSFGHSNAGVAELRAGIAAGGKAFTHLGNGCPQSLDRHDNILWRVLDQEGLSAGIIPDGIHVSPACFRLLHRALGPSRIYWTTDAMAAAGAPAGRYTLGEMELEVGLDRVVRNPLSNSFAGSALEALGGVRKGAEMLGISWREAWDFMSLHPARLMNIQGEAAVGSPAGFCLLQEREE